MIYLTTEKQYRITRGILWKQVTGLYFPSKIWWIQGQLLRSKQFMYITSYITCDMLYYIFSKSYAYLILYCVKITNVYVTSYESIHKSMAINCLPHIDPQTAWLMVCFLIISKVLYYIVTTLSWQKWHTYIHTKRYIKRLSIEYD